MATPPGVGTQGKEAWGDLVRPFSSSSIKIFILPWEHVEWTRRDRSLVVVVNLNSPTSQPIYSSWLQWTHPNPYKSFCDAKVSHTLDSLVKKGRHFIQPVYRVSLVLLWKIQRWDWSNGDYIHQLVRHFPFIANEKDLGESVCTVLYTL